MNVGQVVFSKCGRDKGNAFVVIETRHEYLYLVDGKLRTLDKPKKKKIKHVQPVNHVINLAEMESSIGGRALQDADIRKELKAFAERSIPHEIREGGRSHCQKMM